MRRHGWELPYHPLQVVAIAVFLALGFAFFVFFVPFVGSHLMEIVVSSVYAPLMALAFGLYIWCAACDPSDPAVLRAKKSSASRMTSPSVCFTGDKDKTSTEPTQPSSAQTKSDQGRCEEDMLYCSLCEVEVLKCSKHCRVCDKCVDCFDHHCRWLNNCIGRRNYRIFIALMISGVCMLIVQWAVGVWVIARCFLDRRQFQQDVSSKLGSSFSVIPFVCVVGICTVLAAFATLPLGQLCLFHALLIQKGISTYDYILAMRERDQQQNGGSEKLPSPYASPASSVTTAMSGASSIGTLHHAPWCTPPRLFVDHEQTPIQLDRVKSINSELTPKKPYPENKEKKAAVKLSSWALARLNPEDAFRAVAEARKSSSVLRPVQRKAESTTMTETDSSDDSTNYVTRGSPVISSNARVVPPPEIRDGIPWPAHAKHPIIATNVPHGSVRSVQNQGPQSAAALIPLQLEARNAFCGSGVLLSQSSSSSRSSVASPDDMQELSRGTCSEQEKNAAGKDHPAPWENAWHGRFTNDGYEASGGESADDSDGRYHTPANTRKDMMRNIRDVYGDDGKRGSPRSRCPDMAILCQHDRSSSVAAAAAVIESIGVDATMEVQGLHHDFPRPSFCKIVIPDLKSNPVASRSYVDISSSLDIIL